MITLAVIAGYLVVGAVYARSQAARLYVVAKKKWDYEDMTRESLGWMIAWRVAAWPWGMVFDIIRGPLRTWFMAPINDRKAKAEQLRRDADYWRQVAREEVNDEKRAMADLLATTLREQAREVDL